MNSWKRVTILVFVAVVLAALTIGSCFISTGGYEGRNGAAEALDDAVAGLPLKLYYYRYDQIDPGMRTPGIYCPRLTQSSGFGKLNRVRIEQADFSEGHKLTRAEWRSTQAARAFAYLYNTTMYDAHRAELQRACSGIKLEPFIPELRNGG